MYIRKDLFRSRFRIEAFTDMKRETLQHPLNGSYKLQQIDCLLEVEYATANEH